MRLEKLATTLAYAALSSFFLAVTVLFLAIILVPIGLVIAAIFI